MTPRVNDWAVSENGRQLWQATCSKLAEGNSLAGFRQLPIVCDCVEVMDAAAPGVYWQQLLDLDPRWLDRVGVLLHLDTIGDSFKHPVGDGELKFSGAMLRYALTLARLDRVLGCPAGWSVVEVGGGYGGMAALMQSVYPPASYTIFDLPECQRLQQVYLREAVGAQSANVHFNQLPAGECDLFLSTFALSELGPEGRDMYRDLIRRCRRGFLLWNMSLGSEPRRFSQHETVEAWLREATGTTVRWNSHAPNWLYVSDKCRTVGCRDCQDLVWHSSYCAGWIFYWDRSRGE